MSHRRPPPPGQRGPPGPPGGNQRGGPPGNRGGPPGYGGGPPRGPPGYGPPSSGPPSSGPPSSGPPSSGPPGYGGRGGGGGYDNDGGRGGGGRDGGYDGGNDGGRGGYGGGRDGGGYGDRDGGRGGYGHRDGGRGGYGDRDGGGRGGYGGGRGGGRDGGGYGDRDGGGRGGYGHRDGGRGGYGDRDGGGRGGGGYGGGRGGYGGGRGGGRGGYGGRDNREGGGGGRGRDGMITINSFRMPSLKPVTRYVFQATLDGREGDAPVANKIPYEELMRDERQLYFKNGGVKKKAEREIREWAASISLSGGSLLPSLDIIRLGSDSFQPPTIDLPIEYNAAAKPGGPYVKGLLVIRLEYESAKGDISNSSAETNCLIRSIISSDDPADDRPLIYDLERNQYYVKAHLDQAPPPRLDRQEKDENQIEELWSMAVEVDPAISAHCQQLALTITPGLGFAVRDDGLRSMLGDGAQSVTSACLSIPATAYARAYRLMDRRGYGEDRIHEYRGCFRIYGSKSLRGRGYKIQQLSFRELQPGEYKKVVSDLISKYPEISSMKDDCEGWVCVPETPTRDGGEMLFPLYVMAVRNIDQDAAKRKMIIPISRPISKRHYVSYQPRKPGKIALDTSQQLVTSCWEECRKLLLSSPFFEAIENALYDQITVKGISLPDPQIRYENTWGNVRGRAWNHANMNFFSTGEPDDPAIPGPARKGDAARRDRIGLILVDSRNSRGPSVAPQQLAAEWDEKINSRDSWQWATGRPFECDSGRNFSESLREIINREGLAAVLVQIPDEASVYSQAKITLGSMGVASQMFNPKTILGKNPKGIYQDLLGDLHCKLQCRQPNWKASLAGDPLDPATRFCGLVVEKNDTNADEWIATMTVSGPCGSDNLLSTNYNHFLWSDKAPQATIQRALRKIKEIQSVANPSPIHLFLNQTTPGLQNTTLDFVKMCWNEEQFAPRDAVHVYEMSTNNRARILGPSSTDRKGQMVLEKGIFVNLDPPQGSSVVPGEESQESIFLMYLHNAFPGTTPRPVRIRTYTYPNPNGPGSSASSGGTAHILNCLNSLSQVSTKSVKSPAPHLYAEKMQQAIKIYRPYLRSDFKLEDLNEFPIHWYL